MITYITAFIFYTLAMVGIMLVGFVIYKKTGGFNRNDNKGMMKVLDCMQIAPKKNLLVVRVKNEKFLIASDAEHTTFLAKLQEDGQNSKNYKQNREQYKEAIRDFQYKEPQYVEPREQYSETYDQNSSDYMSKYAKNEKPMDEFQRARLDKIQRQFRELYELEPAKKEKDNVTTRKEAVKQLLRELNETTSQRAGSRF